MAFKCELTSEDVSLIKNALSEYIDTSRNIVVTGKYKSKKVSKAAIELARNRTKKLEKLKEFFEG